ncbi:phage tail protein [Herbaspirillum sp. 1130]|uniref:host specificity protein J n=1 Tax=Herbaspirillum sp. 1130 TaxID=2806562 RepID=UPI001AEA3C85|nr:phage tail protein [Herbaspirillum sp. 1130]MBP1314533.1 putative phage tail protein [Herbaspirillum sp. 1130]
MRGLVGYGGGGKSGSEGHAAEEAPDSLKSISYAKVIDLVSEGPVVGLVNGAQSIFLNETPLQNADGSYNFSGFQWEFRPGTQFQSYIPGFPEVANELAASSELRSDTPWTRSITNLQLSGLRVRLSVPGLSQTDSSNGDVKGYRVEYVIELSTDGGAFQVVVSSAFDGKTTSKYSRSHRFNLPRATVSGWRVRVRRLTPNANSARIVDTTMVESYTELIDAKLRYPMSALMALMVDASQFQSVPSRAYLMKLRIIAVPSNYDPDARTYSGLWDGTWKPAWTDNPVWIYYDLVLHKRYGAGKRVDASQIDKWELYRIARYCDELVPDGKGGYEPRFACNVYIQKEAAAYRVLQDLASIFRGIVYWGGGKMMTSADMPGEPMYVYTAANVVDGKFTRVGSSRRTRYTTALVSWNDPTDFYRAKNEYVEDAIGIERYGFRPLELTAFGCTSQGQAQRAGRWALATSRLETETITFQVGMEGAIAAPGQIVRVADPKKMGRRNGGRIRAVNGRTITLDKAPTVSPGDTFTVIMPTAVSEDRLVESVDGDDVTVTVAFSSNPEPQSIWYVGSVDLVAPTYKVMSVTQKDGLIFEITALQHEPGKFDYVEQGTLIGDRPTSVVPMRFQPPPTNVRLSTYTTSTKGASITTLVIAWDAAVRASEYQIEWRRDNGEWYALPRTGGLSAEVPGIYAGAYQVRVRAFNSIDVGSAVALSNVTPLQGNQGPPQDVPWFSINGDVLTWGAVIDAELAGYRLRYHYGSNRSWGDANDLVDGLVMSSPYKLVSTPQGPLTLLIKAENRQGDVSNSPSYIVTQLGDALVANVVEEFDFHADGYPGVIDGAQIIDGALLAEGTLQFWKNDLADFWPLDDSQVFFSDSYKRMVYETPAIIPAAVAASLQLTLDVEFQGGARTIEYRSGGGEPFFQADGMQFFAGDDDLFYRPLSGYIPWPGSLAAQAIQYQFRFSVDIGSERGEIGKCKALIDVPDIDERFDDIAISETGTRLPLKKSFLNIQNVQLTLQADGGAAVTARCMDKSHVSGPLIRCFNSAGAAVAGLVDAHIQGY